MTIGASNNELPESRLLQTEVLSISGPHQAIEIDLEKKESCLVERQQGELFEVLKQSVIEITECKYNLT